MNLGGSRRTVATLIPACALVAVASTALTGCGAGVPGTRPAGGGDGPTHTGHGPTVTADTDDPVALTIVADGPFGESRIVLLSDAVTEFVDGDISSGRSVEVFDIGAVAAGDRLVISAAAVDRLDPVLAVFDADGDAMIVNDDRSFYGGDLDAAIDVRSRRDTDHCYVAVAASYLSGTTGGYVLSLRRSSGGALPQPSPQKVYLNFDGADAISIGRRPPLSIPIFEGSLVGVEFEDRTELLIEQTVAQMRRDYIGLNVEFVSSREGPKPGGPHTTIHFGAYDPGLLGIADYVDEYNEVVSQKAIIFVDTFQAFLPLGPSVEEMSHALSNVASHETAHLLGLNHTVDPRSIMDISANLRQMLASQAFRRAPLHEEVFPLGHQEPAELLIEAVGGDAGLFKAAAAEQLTLRAVWYDEGEPVPARLDQPFSTCTCPSCVKHRHARQRSSHAND